MTWPFENDTSAIVKKLADRSMKADKRSKTFLLLTIALSVCMVFSIILISTGTQLRSLKLISEAEYQLVEKKLKKDYGVISNITA